MALAAGVVLLPTGQGVASAAATTGVSYISHEKPPLCRKDHCGRGWWGRYHHPGFMWFKHKSVKGPEKQDKEDGGADEWSLDRVIGGEH